MCPWAWQRSKSPRSLALILTDNHSEVRRGGLYPARVVCVWAWQRSKSPWSLALTVTDNRVRGVGVDFTPPGWCVWAWQRSKKPLELSSHRDRQPE